MRILLLGPPGVGKGTQAALLSAAIDAPVVSTGELLRAHVARASDLGRAVSGVLNAGHLVPSRIVGAMVEARLSEPDAQDGFILDGYPRTISQVADLDRMLGRRDSALDAAILLEAPDELVVARLLHRGATSHRTDDVEGVITDRLAVYRQETLPVIRAYERRELLTRMDAVGDPDDIHRRILGCSVTRESRA